MENSKNKSLITKGSSNLAKTEKLLSITPKILSEIKLQYESVRIGNQEWMTRNLNVNRFRNGDLIPHLEFDEEWIVAEKNGQPAWCYYNNDPKNGKKSGKLYNWYAVNDPRGLAPEGWHIPTYKEWTILKKFLDISTGGWKLKSVEGWNKWKDEYGKFQNGNGDNSSGFNVLPGGYRNYSGSFGNIRSNAFFWSATKDDNSLAWDRNLSYASGRVKRKHGLKENGLSVRCIRDY